VLAKIVTDAQAEIDDMAREKAAAEGTIVQTRVSGRGAGKAGTETD
jgi:hypothetical protein